MYANRQTKIIQLLFKEIYHRVGYSLLNKDKAILAGIIAGIFALTGIYGISFYFLNYLFTSIFIFIHVQRQRGNFFESVFSLLLQGLFNHLMVFTIFWVMFYNLVHIYV